MFHIYIYVTLKSKDCLKIKGHAIKIRGILQGDGTKPTDFLFYLSLFIVIWYSLRINGQVKTFLDTE